jgi:tetratricopeptide (TPR) repeat protein
MGADTSEFDTIFCAAIAIASAQERAAYIAGACGSDSELRGRVERLVNAHFQAGSFMEVPAVGSAPLLERGEQETGGVATVNAPRCEAPGAVIGPYKLLEQIGEGGFGVVFMAEQTQPVRRKVALKVLKPGMDTRQVIARFEAERQALALMDHPNIAHVLDGGETASGRPYFVMELVRGIPITEFCDQNHLPIRQRLELFAVVCQAVQHAHQKGIIHRDIKPSNVMVTLHDDKPVVKVIDFGIAKATGQQLTEKTLFTNLAQMIGTPLYMSPEQAHMTGLDVDTRSDIYSLGVLLYELLTGTTPFDKERLKEAGYDEMRRIIREEEPPRPSTRISTMGQASATISTQRKSDPKQLSRLFRGELDWIVMKALEKDRNRRYETASAFAADIERYLHDEPVQACPPSALYRFRKFARRNKRELAAALLFVFFIVVMGSGVGWIVRDRAARRAETAQRVGESLTRARSLIAQNKLPLARQELARARGQMANDNAAPGHLVEDVERFEEEIRALETDLAKVEDFLALLEQAHDAEMSAPVEPALETNGSSGRAPAPAKAGGERQPDRAVPILLAALARYQVLERADWNTALEGGSLAREQAEQIRRRIYEELLWLAADVLTRRHDHRSERQLTRESAARQALTYLAKAETARPATQALFALRGTCRERLGEDTAARADFRLVRKTAPTLPVDHWCRGLAAFDAKQLQKAIDAFEAALALEPTDYSSLLWLGHCLGDLGQVREHFTAAVGIYSGCILKRPAHAHAYFCRGIVRKKLNQEEKAISDYSRAIALRPERPEVWYSRGNAYHSLGQEEKAIRNYSRAIELRADFPDAWNNRGTAYHSLGQNEQALKNYSRAIALKADHAVAWYNRGRTYHELRQTEKALADYSQAIKLKPADARFWNERGLVYKELRDWDKGLADYSKAIDLDPTFARALGNRGNVYRSLGQLDKALVDYSKAIELAPKLAGAWNNRGVVYLDLRQLDRALADFSKAIELDPRDSRAFNNRGMVYLDLGQPDKALADYSKATELDSKNAAAWNGRGIAYERLGQLEKAIDNFSRAIRLDPNRAMAWKNRGSAYNNLGQPDKALVDCSKAIELDQKLAPAWNARGVAYRLLGQTDKAIADFSTAIALDVKYAAAWSNRGGVYNDLGQAQKALADCSRAVALDQKHAMAWNNRGVAYGRLGQWDRAVADFSRAVTLDAKYPDAWLNRGDVYRVSAQPEKAVADYSRAIELMMPNDRALPHIYQARAESHGRLARFEQARTDLQTALKLAPTSAVIQNALAWLLATCPEARLRDPDQAVELAKKAVHQSAKDGGYWNTLGVAHYRAGNWKAAVTALDKSVELRQGGDAFDLLFLAMAHQKLDNHLAARKAYDRALHWIEKNKETLDKDKAQAEELRRFRSEAEAVLELKK